MELPQYLQSIKEMPDATANKIAGYFVEEEFEDKTLIIQEGKTSKKSYFLKTGIVRCFTTDLNGAEVSTRFFSAPDFLNDYLSFFNNQASEENYETIGAVKVHALNFENMQYCFHNIPEFREWGRMLLTLNYVSIHQRMLSFLKESAEARYLKLLNDQPEVIQQVPLKIIASYIGVTDSSLSRIRKEISDKS